MRNVPKNNINNYHDDDTIDLHQLWVTVWNGKKIIIGIFIVVVVFTAIRSLIMTPIYRSATTIMPISSKYSLLGDLSAIAALTGASVGTQIDDTQKIMAVLNSRSIKVDLITKMNLIEVFGRGIPAKRNPVIAVVNKLNSIITVTSDKKTGIITVYVDYENPELARDIANNYIEVLQEILNTKSLTVNRIRREFLEKQINQLGQRFSKEQKNMAKFQKKTKMIQPVEQTRGTMTLYSELMSKKTELEIQVKSMSIALAPDSPILKSLYNQLNIINEKIKEIEGNGDLGALPSIGSAPDKIVEYSNLFNDLEVSKNVYEILLKLYEKAKIDEAQEDLFVQVIDPAITPDTKFKPQRTLMVGIAGIASLFFGIFLVFFLEWRKKFQKSI